MTLATVMKIHEWISTDKQLESSTALLHLLSHLFNWFLIGAENRAPFNSRYLNVPTTLTTSFILYSLAGFKPHPENDTAVNT